MAEEPPILHEVISVSATANSGVYIAKVDLTDMAGERYECDYVSAPDDTVGLAPTIRAALDQWIADDSPVTPYVPPAPEELRALMPPLTSRQLRLGLHRNDLLGQVDGAIASLLEPQRTEAQIEWEYGTTFERLNPTMLAVIAALSLAPEQADQMWTEAAAL